MATNFLLFCISSSIGIPYSSQLMHPGYLIYIIEDNPIDTLIVRRLLYKLSKSCQLQSVSSGNQALHELKAILEQGGRFPDIILLDLEMPLFSGWDFLDNYIHLEALVASPCRIYILSASINPVDLLKAKHYRYVAGFISKPLQMKHLQAILE